MDCPACHAENPDRADTCSACGKPLRSGAPAADKPARRGGRRKATEEADSGPDADPAARRAYRVSLWSLIPGAGLLLGPVAVLLGVLAVRNVRDDPASRNRARAAVLFGALVTLTQWLGLALMIRGWG